MKCKMALSVCAIAMTAMLASAVFGLTVDVGLNLRYNDPADPTEGGIWQLVAKTDDANGIAGLSAYISGVGSSVDFSSPYPYGPSGPVSPATGDIRVHRCTESFQKNKQPRFDQRHGVWRVHHGQKASL